MDTMDPLAKKYLGELLQRTQGRTDAQVSMFDIGAVMGLEKDAARRTAEDLIAEGLVEIKTLSGAIGITPQGIEMAQKSSGVDSGADLALGDTPVLDDQGRKALDNVLTAIKDHLARTPTPFDRLEEMVVDIKTIEVQLLSPRPKTAIIRTILHSMREGLQMTDAAPLVANLDKLTGA
jgi:hypothetical protein